MENRTKNIIFIILVGLSFFGGYFFNATIHEKAYKAAFDLDGMDLTILKEVYDKAVFNFVDPSKIDKQKMTYGAVSGMIKALDDPYTVFYNPEESKEFQEDISGSFEGVGMQLGVKDNQIKVIAPLKGTPAEKSGILPGDVIIEVDEQSTIELTIEEVTSKIRGQKGTKVTLTIIRTDKEGSPETKKIEIIRDVIKIPTIELETIEKDNKKIAHLIISHFSELVFDDFKKAGYEIINGGYDGIILDLRNNPGGLLDKAVSIAGWFLEKGNVVLTEQNKNLEENSYKADGPANFVNTPLVILIDKGTASASEILTGAIKDNRGVLIIGETSFGKGLVQRVVTLEDGSSLKVTTAKWYTPNKTLIQDTGIKPDIEVELSEEDIDNNKDPQLDRATEELIKIIK
jgi:carboxyl-terminal processing protease